jgi:hypothetical protein
MLSTTLTACGLLALGLLAASAFPPDDPRTDAPAEAAQPVELGLVAWQRDLDAGLELAAAADKPVLLLFQEVPG